VNALFIDHLRIEYSAADGKKVAVEDLCLEVEPGEFFGLLGPNGAGKTSVISAITGLVPSASGNIKIFGQKAGSREARRLVGFVPQELVSYGFFTVDEILKYSSGYFGISENSKKINELLDRLQLISYRKKLVSQLSGGLKRRLLIAKALLHSPKILLLDEPSAGVDVELRTILWDFMAELNREGMTIVLTTHYLEEAQRLCKRVAILNNGKLLALDATGGLISSLSERVIFFDLKEGDPRRVVAQGKESISEIMLRLNIPLDSVQDIRTEEGSLESAFLKLVGAGHR
jgi:ABC-2 type transport system ATP-binding protein